MPPVVSGSQAHPWLVESRLVNGLEPKTLFEQIGREVTGLKRESTGGQMPMQKVQVCKFAKFIGFDH
jgi:hypothetical protein